MSAKWYYSHRGQTMGPLSDENVEAMISSKKLGPDDLVFLEGDPKWRPLSEISRFKSLLATFIEKPTGNKVEVKDLWVVLVKDEKGLRRQKGPYSTEDIRFRLSAGDIKISDYVWRHGMKNWYRIVSFPELNDPNLKSKNGGQVPPPIKSKSKSIQESDTEALLKDVLELKTQVVKINNEAPPETLGADLVSLGGDPRDISYPEIHSNSSIEIPRSAKAKAKATLQPSGLFTRIMGDRRTYQFLGLMFLALFVLSVWEPVTRKIQTRFGSRPKIITAVIEAPPVTPVIADSETPRIDPTSAPVAETTNAVTPKKPLKPNPPSYVKLVVRNGELQISTDATSNYLATLVFTSEPGELVGSASYFRVLQKAERNIQLTELKWPQGTYQVQVRVGEVEGKAKAFVGVRPPDFSQKLKAYNKSLTLEAMNERLELIAVTKRFVDELRVFQSILSRAGDEMAWQRDFSPWRDRYRRISSPSLRGIGSKNRNRYLFAQSWIGLQNSKKELDSLLGRLARKSERTQQGVLAELRGHLNRFQSEYEAAQNFSLWK